MARLAFRRGHHGETESDLSTGMGQIHVRGKARSQREAAHGEGEAPLPRCGDGRHDVRGPRDRRHLDTRDRHLPVHGRVGQRDHRGMHRHRKELPRVRDSEAVLQNAEKHAIREATGSANGAR